MKVLWKKMVKKPDLLSQNEIETLIDLYDAEIKYTDTIIGSMLDKLSNYLPDTSSNTFVIITADHGDEFKEHGKFGHQSLYDEILRVPLIIAGPGIKDGTSVKQQVSLVDLAPTILNLVGINSAQRFYGKSMLPQIKGKEIEMDRMGTISTFSKALSGQMSIAYRVPRWKYISTENLNGNGPIREEVYNLTHDPGETKNLHGICSEEVNKFEMEAKSKITQFKKLKVAESTSYEKQRIRAKLSKLDEL